MSADPSAPARLTTLVFVAGCALGCHSKTETRTPNGYQPVLLPEAAPTPLSKTCPQARLVVRGGHLGPFEVGISIDSLKHMCPAAMRLEGEDAEGTPQTAYALPITDRDTIIAAIDTARGRTEVSSFSIGFSRPHTANGLSVGSTLADVRHEYPHLIADENEGRVYVWPDPDDGLSFALSTPRDALGSNWRKNPSSIPDSARVIELLVRAASRSP